MTIRIREPGLSDKILALIGKKRAVFMPKQELPYGYYIAQREGFFTALNRPKGEKPPEGWMYWNLEDIISEDDAK